MEKEQKIKKPLPMLLDLFLTFLKIGAFTFGGGYSIVAQLKDIVVDKKNWVTDEELTQMIAIAESTPGPIAINMATYIGYNKKGFLGSLLCTLGVILPSLLIIYVISLFLKQFMANTYVQYAFYGIKSAVAFLIIKAGVKMFIKMPKKVIPITVFCVSFITLILFEIFAISFSSIFFILIGGVLGILLYSVFNLKQKEDK